MIIKSLVGIKGFVAGILLGVAIACLLNYVHGV